MNSKSNHPEHVLKHIPVKVNNSLQKILNIQSIFKETTKHYQEAIRAIGYDHELAYSHKHEKGRNKKKKEKKYVIFQSSILQKRGNTGWEVLRRDCG